MHPATISPAVTSSAERILFAELERQLPKPYEIFHSVGIMSRNNHREHHGECDFVIVHPNRGILVLEVKGGRISGRWGANRWTSIDRNDRPHDTANPFLQADKARYTLRDALKARSFPYDPNRHDPVRAVAVPDMLMKDLPLGLDADRAMVLDSTDMASLRAAIERVLTRSGTAEVITRDELAQLRTLLAPQVVIDRPGLAFQILEGKEHILRLTQQQVHLLQQLRRHRQAVINGCAGSGKSILAIEKAIQLAEAGQRVLLTCYNKSLSAWMRQVIDQQPQATRELITVTHYHDLAVRMCAEAGVPTRVEHADADYWRDGIPNDFLDAIARLDTRFDAIVADEGQDFHSTWWITLQELLSSPDAVFYIFQDEHQDLYGRSGDLPIAVTAIDLDVNFRSSAPIHDHVVAYFDGDPKPVSGGPQGREIDVIPCEPGKDIGKLTPVIARLINDEGIDPGQIVVLSPVGAARSVLKEGTNVGGYNLTRSAPVGPREILVSSIHGFKGLESDIVILAETSSLATRKEGRMLTYVALSRARHHLIVVGALPTFTVPADMAH